jgi:pimeloyl-ACP methyl ester carboxylesterase
VATVDNIVLEYEVFGTGAPVVTIHGALIADTFRPLAAESALVPYQVITYHRRGYAGSVQSAGPIRAEQQAADCLALLRYLRVERAHVVGHSFGGSIALQLAVQAPEVVHSLVLLEPALFVGESAAAYRASLERGAQRYRSEDPAVVVDEFLRARWGGPEYRAALDRVLPGAFAQAVADAGATFEGDIGLLDWRFGETEARRIVQPTLCVLGGESEALSPRFGEAHRLLLAWLPAAEGFVLPGVMHFLQLEDPHSTANVLAAFWGRHPLPHAAQ